MEFEYKSIIEIDRNIAAEELKEITRIIEEAFDNRAGTVKNTSEDPYVFIFEGNEPEWNCLMLGNLSIGKNKKIFFSIISWNWFDRDFPEENGNLKEDYKQIGCTNGWWK